ncbi:MAG: hypothetical protein Ct9H300mP11_24490 [Chloroflexota bacterium]|nr:MAG: hypothetical protein Ct9H300mP11_24490 [Chloroflexota bacterium]
MELAGKNLQLSSGVTTINVAHFSEHARGVYLVKGKLFSGRLSSVPFLQPKGLRVCRNHGYSSHRSTAAAGVSALASWNIAANGLDAKLNAKIQVSNASLVVGKMGTGPCLETLHHQHVHRGNNGIGHISNHTAGRNQATVLSNAMLGMIAGGSVSFGFGYSLGVIKTFIKAPAKD